MELSHALTPFVKMILEKPHSQQGSLPVFFQLQEEDHCLLITGASFSRLLSFKRGESVLLSLEQICLTF